LGLRSPPTNRFHIQGKEFQKVQTLLDPGGKGERKVIKTEAGRTCGTARFMMENNTERGGANKGNGVQDKKK